MTVTASSPSKTSTQIFDQAIDIRTRVGIGIGGTAGLLCMIVVLWIAGKHYNKKRKVRLVHNEDNRVENNQQCTTTDTENAELRSPAWSGYKAELPANQSQTESPSVTSHGHGNRSSDIEGLPAPEMQGRALRNGGYMMPGHQGTIFELP